MEYANCEEVIRLAEIAIQVANSLEQLEKCGLFCEGVGQPLWLELKGLAENLIPEAKVA